jgi:hypothetical protein
MADDVIAAERLDDEKEARPRWSGRRRLAVALVSVLAAIAAMIAWHGYFVGSTKAEEVVSNNQACVSVEQFLQVHPGAQPAPTNLSPQVGSGRLEITRRWLQPVRYTFIPDGTTTRIAERPVGRPYAQIACGMS